MGKYANNRGGLLLVCAALAVCVAAQAEPLRLRVGLYDNPPKIGADAHGRATGILPALLERIAARHGWELEYVPCAWEACLRELETGALDLMPDVALTDGREARFQFHHEPALVAWTQGYRAPGLKIGSVFDLQDRRIAVLGGSIQQEFAVGLINNFGIAAHVVPVSSFDGAFRAVADGQADVALVNNFYGDANAVRFGLRDTPLVYQPARLFFASRRGLDPAVPAAIDAWLREVKANPESDYFAIISRHRAAPLPRWLLPVGACGGVVLAVLAWMVVRRTRRLRHEIADSTRQLHDSEIRLGTILDHADSLIYIKDRAYRYQYANEAMARFIGRAREEIIGRTDDELIDAAQAEQRRVSDQVVLDRGERVAVELTARDAEGATRTYMSRKIPLRNATGEIYALCGISTEITEQRKAEASRLIAAKMFESMVGMAVTDAQGLITESNRALEEMLGADGAQRGKRLPPLASTPGGTDIWDSVLFTLRQSDSWQGEAWLDDAHGGYRPVMLAVSAVRGSGADTTGLVVTLLDLTREKQAVDEANRLAFYDPLTSLPNRRLLLQRLQGMKDGGTALLHLNLDHFKSINALHGHDCGDEILVSVARRLLHTVKGSDVVARLGADQFAIVLNTAAWNGGDLRVGAERGARALLEAVAQPVMLRGTPQVITCSIGIAPLEAALTEQEAMLAAEAASVQARQQGGNQFCYFDDALRARTQQRSQMESALRRAVAREELRVVYQVQTERDGRVSGAEALARWREVPADQFIPLAEETGLIIDLGRWVLRQACLELARWDAQPARRHYTLSVNVSARQFADAGFVQDVLDAIAASGCDPARLRLELTESLFIQDVSAIIAKMHELKSHGITFALDDFGTGYSTLAYLKRLPFDELKIDKSFVRDVLHDPNDAAIVRGIVAVAASLNMQLIAEGVETEAQRAFLEEIGCYRYQGYLYGRPGSAEDFDGKTLAPAT